MARFTKNQYVKAKYAPGDNDSWFDAYYISSEGNGYHKVVDDRGVVEKVALVKSPKSEDLVDFGEKIVKRALEKTEMIETNGVVSKDAVFKAFVDIAISLNSKQ